MPPSSPRSGKRARRWLSGFPTWFSRVPLLHDRGRAWHRFSAGSLFQSLAAAAGGFAEPGSNSFVRPKGHRFSPVLTGRCCMRKWRKESVLDLYNLLLAIFLFVSPWLLARASGTAVVDLRVSGAIIAILSLVAMFAYADWEEWVKLLLGIWLIVSPWLLGFAHTSAMHYSIGIGVAIAFFSALELWLVYDAAHAEPAAHAPEKK